ncbi:MAG: Cell division protein FtsH [uncultured Solirubrobacteraceae bacterium]|uniref:Cell division protein FtsH n=1 Tax=uncultured Solirubrobacteraceae bacterium TaxID=1162706 RepID=A0A6J4REU5_9ACTN|nr:MAG: Cell division protein FtsH [uncultured Solirubrobacteraceae bacterium]
MSLPEEDQYLKTREDLIDYMTVCLGGRVAEQTVFGAVTTGAANDLQKVAEITNAMINQYAMGPAASGQRAWMDIEMASERSKQIRDEEQREIVWEAERVAQEIITENRAKLDELALTLLEQEVLDRSDLDRILGDVKKLERARPRAAAELRLAAADPGAPPTA